MSQYFKYTPTQNDYTTLRFVDDGKSNCQIKHFDTYALLIDGDPSDISSLRSRQPLEIDLTEIAFDEFFALASKSNQAIFELDTLAKKFKVDCDNLTGGASVDESLSWKKQEERAREVLKDPTKPSPQISALADARGLNETNEQLAQKIVANADAYEMAYLGLLGQYQAAKKAVVDV